jgi:hypothetical protein
MGSGVLVGTRSRVGPGKVAVAVGCAVDGVQVGGITVSVGVGVLAAAAMVGRAAIASR